MNVDNNLKVFKYNGYGPVVQVPFERAYDVRWRNSVLSVYPNRGPSPKRGTQHTDMQNNAISAYTVRTVLQVLCLPLCNFFLFFFLLLTGIPVVPFLFLQAAVLMAKVVPNIFSFVSNVTHAARSY